MLLINTIHIIAHTLTLINEIISKIVIWNFWSKGCTPNWSKEVFVMKKVKNTLPWTHVIIDLNSEEIVGTFYEKELNKNKSKRF